MKKNNCLTALIVSLIAALVVICAIAQPPLPGDGKLTWLPNPATDYVTHYTVYLVKDNETNNVLKFTTITNEIAFASMTSTNGHYTVGVSASNPNGEGPRSTNMNVHFVPSKPGPPKGLDTADP